MDKTPSNAADIFSRSPPGGLNLPLLYEMVAARQIVKNAELGIVPVVIITHDDEVDPAAIMEAGVRRNEYVHPAF